MISGNVMFHLVLMTKTFVIPDNQLHTIMKSMRTRVGKVLDMMHQTGKGADDPDLPVTERDLSIFHIFKFLDAHFVRKKTGKTGKVSSHET